MQRRPTLRMLLATWAFVWVGASAAAQTALFDADRLVLACQTGSCVTEARQAVLTMRQSARVPADRNSQIGLMAALMIQAAETEDPAVRSDIVEAMTLLAGGSSDAVQQNALADAAIAVQRGAVDAVGANEPFAASPTRPRRRVPPWVRRWRYWRWVTGGF